MVACTSDERRCCQQSQARRPRNCPGRAQQLPAAAEAANVLSRLVELTRKYNEAREAAAPLRKIEKDAEDELRAAKEATRKLLKEPMFFERSGGIFKITEYGDIYPVTIVSI